MLYLEKTEDAARVNYQIKFNQKETSSISYIHENLVLNVLSIIWKGNGLEHEFGL